MRTLLVKISLWLPLKQTKYAERIEPQPLWYSGEQDDIQSQSSVASVGHGECAYTRDAVVSYDQERNVYNTE